MRFKKITKSIICSALSLIMFSAILFPLRTYADAGGEIIVSAAGSLKDAFKEIGALFEKGHPGIKVLFNFGASGVLRRQIEGGAPVDILASASVDEITTLDAEGLIIKGTRFDFAENSIVLIAPAGFGLVQSFNDLKKTGVKRIAICNPETVPAGKYSKEALMHMGQWDSLNQKFVFAENVRQALDYAVRNEVDAAMVFQTDALNRNNLRVIKAPPETYGKAIYSAAAIRNSGHQQAASEFLSFLKSPEARTILKKYGFKMPGR